MIKLKKARTCEGCKAYIPSNTGTVNCEIGFSIKKQCLTKHFFQAVPETRCYKPVNIHELFEAQRMMQGSIGRATLQMVKDEMKQ